VFLFPLGVAVLLYSFTMSAETLAQAEKLIPATVRMISGCSDEQTSADGAYDTRGATEIVRQTDSAMLKAHFSRSLSFSIFSLILLTVANVAEFSLPDPAGRAGGACTSALLQVLYKEKEDSAPDFTFQQVLLKMRNVLAKDRFDQIPQLSSSRPLNIQTKFHLVPDNFTGTRRAVMIGINYTGQQGQLSGCHNDVRNMLEYIKKVHGFKDENITLLLDAKGSTQPTYANIIAAYKKVAADSVSGDAVFCHYSGHGGRLKDQTNEEKDGYDETLVPVDYDTAGQIRDDDLFTTLVGPMARGVLMTCVMDCCHSGTVLELPFVFTADGEHESMSVPPDFDFATLEGLFQKFVALRSQGTGVEEGTSVIQSCCAMM
jgi:hypothetical protein